MTANIEGLKLYSVQGNPDVADEDAVIDEKGNKYEYIEQTNGEFANGGTAAFDATEAKLTMERVTPGDKVEMTLTGANASNVAIQYRYSIKCLNGQTLMAGLNVYIAEGTNQLVKYESLNSYTTAWRDLAAETAMTDVALVIELPVTAGNEHQDLDAEIELTVEAVQGNAVTTNDDVLVTYIEKAATATDVERLLTNDAVDYIYLAEDLEDAIDLGGNLTDKTIDANGNNAIFNIAADANLENVVIKNIVDNDNASAINVAAGAKGVLTIEASELGGGENRPVNGASNPDLALTLKDCEISDYNYAA